MFLAHFWSIFPSFGAKIVFLENLAPSRTTSYGFLEPCQDLEKTNNTIPRKRPDRRKDGRTDGRTEGRMEGRKDGQTLFHRTIPTTAGVPKNVKCVQS